MKKEETTIPSNVSESLRRRIIHVRNRKRSKWERCSDYYKDHYINCIRQQKWNSTLKRVSMLRAEISEIHIEKIRTLQDTLETLVHLVSLTTQFLDEGLITEDSLSKKEAVDNFNSYIIFITCREKTPIGYWNSTQPGEEVNFDTLYIGDAEEVSEYEIKKKKIPAFMLKQYAGKTFRIIAPMTPATKWLKGKMKPFVGRGSKTLNINIYQFIKFFYEAKRKLLENCDNILGAEV